jgi:hypothetical protein
MRHRVAVNRGNPEQPLTNSDIELKYFDNCALNLPHAHALRVRDMVLDLETVTSVAKFEAELASN